MHSSRKGRGFSAGLWREFLAGSLCTASFLNAGGAIAQDAPQPLLNPFSKPQPALRTSATVSAPKAQPATIGGLRPATIRPVSRDAIANPHVAQAAKPAATAAVARLPAKVEEEPELTPIPAMDEPAEPSSRPLAIVNPTIARRPLTIVNPTIAPRPLRSASEPAQLRPLEAETDEENLAPIVTPAAARRRMLPPPVVTEDAEPPKVRPIGTTFSTARPGVQTAATEEIDEPALRSIVVAAPRPLSAESLQVQAPAADAPVEEVAEEPAEEAEPLPPIVSATTARQLRPQADADASPRASANQFEDRRPSRTILVQNEAQPAPPAQPERAPGAAPAVLPEGSPFEQIRESGSLAVQVRRSLLLRTQTDVFRTAVVDDSVCEIVQFTPRELSIIGRSLGSTHITFWFDDPNMLPITYEVDVLPDAKQVKIEEEQYQLLEDVLNEMFPDSKIHLTLAANKLIVRGQAKDSEEAFQIMTIIRGQGNTRAGLNNPWNAGINEGQAAQPLADTATGAARRAQYQIVNMLRVPGVQQVALRVKIAELNRSAARNFGIDFKGTININDSSRIILNSLSSVGSGETPPILFNVDGDDISIGLNALQQHGVVKLLSEPTLVTMSGRPATFLAGGEFAVPTVVGSAGLNAVTTDFRAFGAIISFLPTVVDKDRIRLEVAPEFSEINNNLSTGGASTGSIPSLNVRAATTTVEMREGQTLAIAGLLQDSMTANNAGDLPFLQRIIGRRGVTRNENELIILVTPELVHPMEPEEVPPLPGFDVTEPTNTQFYLHGDLEGNPTMDYRSTVWPRLKKRYKAGGPAMTSGPFGHGQ
ncbi:MAG TPA: pilus assembly protein N-terminal domain-containing protein [Pirellulaceae bacterium]|nr:pilus assembly protein N-terminal domain-containing protein [Pirellulaceae bacterium]